MVIHLNWLAHQPILVKGGVETRHGETYEI